MTGNINHVTIVNCKRLHVRKGTFSRSGQLNRVTFENIDDLIMEAFALEFPLRMPPPKINVKFNRVSNIAKWAQHYHWCFTNFLIFIQVNVIEMASYALSGSIENIEFVGCRIGTILAFAINCVSDVLYNISFDDCLIDRIESQAFKNMRLQYFVFRNTFFTTPLVNRAFYRMTINDNFSIRNCTFGTISAGAIQLNGVFYVWWSIFILDEETM